MTACEVVTRPLTHDGRLYYQAECDLHHWVTVRDTQGEIDHQVEHHMRVVDFHEQELRAAGLEPQSVSPRPIS